MGLLACGGKLLRMACLSSVKFLRMARLSSGGAFLRRFPRGLRCGERNLSCGGACLRHFPRGPICQRALARGLQRILGLLIVRHLQECKARFVLSDLCELWSGQGFEKRDRQAYAPRLIPQTGSVQIPGRPGPKNGFAKFDSLDLEKTPGSQRKRKMGVPYLYRSLTRDNAAAIVPVTGKVACQILALDFNCALHRHFEDPLRGLKEILDLFAGPEVVYIAIDGVAPMAKQIQQRHRRHKTETPERNQISPGTTWMKALEKSVAAFVAGLPYPVVFSPSSEAGEGEHKIVQWLRTKAPTERADVIVYGLDADLIVIGKRNGVGRLLRENDEIGVAAPGYSLLDLTKLTLPPAVHLFGNDFLPPVAVFQLRQGGLGRMAGLKDATDEATTLAGAAAQEGKWLADIQAARVKRPPPEDFPRELLARERTIRFGEPGWRFRYYGQLFRVASEEEIQKICIAYWRGLEWVRAYYEDETVLSWEWSYPHGDAPLASDLARYRPAAAFRWLKGEQKPPSMRSQLRFILPAASWALCGLKGEPEGPAWVPGAPVGWLFRTFAWELR